MQEEALKFARNEMSTDMRRWDKMVSTDSQHLYSGSLDRLDKLV